NKSANKSSAVTGRRKGSLAELSRRGAHFFSGSGLKAGGRGCRQPYLYATRRIILLIGSLTCSAAFGAESHLTWRSCFSGHSFRWRFPSSGKTRTSHSTDLPFFRRFAYENEPTGRLPTAPTTPASSNASRAAERWGDLPLFGQPFGMIPRRVSREVTSMNSA